MTSPAESIVIYTVRSLSLNNLLLNQVKGHDNLTL